MTEISLPSYTDIAIVGAGPQALTLVTHLLQKRTKRQHRFIVLDPSGTWRHLFAAQEIPYLRSPAVHHPAPNPYALRHFAETRPDELFSPYDLPGTQLFEDFCFEVIRHWHLENRVYSGKVRQIIPIFWKKQPRFHLILADGQSLTARRVVLATGGGQSRFPQWVHRISFPYPPERLCHSQQLDLRTVQLLGKRVVIVGGGLTSGHLALGALLRGATVTLMARREWQEKLFDADPGWLGPKYLKGFAAESDWYRRWELIQQARNGGSITPQMMLQLRRATRQGQLILQERCEVVEAAWQEQQWFIKCADEKILTSDFLWLATGTLMDASQHPLLEILSAYSTPIIKGLPFLDEHLRLPGTEFFLMGGLAALQVGPAARNLAGGRMACERIVPALVIAIASSVRT